MAHTTPIQKGERVEVEWHQKGWLPGTFEGYCSGDLNEDFQRCIVNMDGGYPCHPPGYHPDAVRRLA